MVKTACKDCEVKTKEIQRLKLDNDGRLKVIDGQAQDLHKFRLRDAKLADELEKAYGCDSIEDTLQNRIIEKVVGALRNE